MKIISMRVHQSVPLSFSTGRVLIAGERGLEIEPCEGGVMLRDTMAVKGARSIFVPIANVVCMEVETEDGGEG